MPFLFEELGEEVGAALAVRLVGEQNGHGLGLPGFGHVIGQDLGLLVDAGAAPVEIIAIAAELGGGGGGADLHHFGVIGDFAGRHHAAGGHGADDGHDFIHVDELLHRVHRGGGGVFLVFEYHFHLAAVDAAGLIDLLHRQFHPPLGGDAVLGPHGQPQHRTDLDGVGPEGEAGS